MVAAAAAAATAALTIMLPTTAAAKPVSRRGDAGRSGDSEDDGDGAVGSAHAPARSRGGAGIRRMVSSPAFTSQGGGSVGVVSRARRGGTSSTSFSPRAGPAECLSDHEAHRSSPVFELHRPKLSLALVRTSSAMASLPGTPLVVDNGAYNCRVGWAGAESPFVVAPNCTARVPGQIDPFVADQIEKSGRWWWW